MFGFSGCEMMAPNFNAMCASLFLNTTIGSGSFHLLLVQWFPTLATHGIPGSFKEILMTGSHPAPPPLLEILL